ncbi:MAG: UDP-N-acetylmuramoyl-L-alanine--D-glutamate ligase [Thermosulfidibacteraceae bacterium]|jgi:UDP-N-acetylmuramoylalanine--D-glutamate ligase
MATLVVGLGLSGYWAGKLSLKKLEGDLYAYDDNLERVNADRLYDLNRYALVMGKRFKIFGRGDFSFLNDIDLVIVSPGIPPNHPLLEFARSKGINIIGDVDFAYRFLDRDKVKLVGVTGTNGKTTTTTLINHGLDRVGLKSVACGNIGFPLSQIVFEERVPEVLVLELSSFQLLYSESLRLDVGLLLNIDFDHMDYHSSFKEYVESKMKIFRGVTLGIYNADDPIVSEKVDLISGGIKLKCFSIREEADSCLIAGSVFVRDDDGRFHHVVDLGKLSPTAIFNLPNILASVLVFDFFGISYDLVGEIVEGFTWLPHRLEFVGALKGVEIYNDSKATNPHAVYHALSHLSRYEKPIVLILGGSGKGLSFHGLSPYFGYLKRVVLYGDAGPEIERDLRSRGCENLIRVWDFGEAVEIALSVAQEGDILLLSPGCASFDQFKSYAERGDVFKRIILSKITEK